MDRAKGVQHHISSVVIHVCLAHVHYLPAQVFLKKTAHEVLRLTCDGRLYVDHSLL